MLLWEDNFIHNIAFDW